MADRLIISDVTADLTGDSPIAVNYQVNDLAKFKDRQALYTNSIKLPLTGNNLAIWGYPNADAFTTDKPYKKLSCKLIRNGVELIPKGVISLISATDYLECQITYGITGFADALKINVSTGGVLVEIRDANLKDLDWSDIPPFLFNLSTVAASQTTRNPLWAIIDYGGTLNDSSIAIMQYLRPGVLYSQIFDRVQRLTGYTFLGGKAYTDGLSDYIPFSDTVLLNQFGQPYASGDLITVAANLPNFTIRNILSDFMNRYFLTPVVDNVRKTITFRSFDELYENKGKAKDWTNKLTNDGESVKFQFGEYAQNNNLTWENDGFFLTPPGSYIITIANETLDTSIDLVTSPFASSENVIRIGGQQVAQIKKIDVPIFGAGEPFTIDTLPRVLHIDKIIGNYQITDGTNTQIVTTFNIGRQSGWEQQTDLYGTGFLRLIKKARSIETQAILTEIDMYNFDHFIPVYNQRESKYYYVNKISNFINGKKTGVSLIRM